MDIREMTSEDIPFAVEITDREEWGYTDDDFAVMMELAPHGCFVAHSEGKKVGMLTTINYGKTAWMGNVVVKADRRKENVGSELVMHAVDHLKSVSVESIGLYSYLDSISFYERIGFKQSFKVGSYSGHVSGPHHQGTRSFAQEAMPAIVSLDQAYFPGDRTRLLSAIVENDPNLFFWSGDSEVRGYVTGFCSSKACVIGPWVCTPERLNLAEDLILDCFAALGDREKTVAIPLVNKKAVHLVEKHGLTKDFEVVAMFYETDESGMNLDGIFGVGSLEMG
jgi:predicted N-acetyltransferase YhbS